jgi:hypothetical protein
MSKGISIRRLIAAIRRLPSDRPRHYPGKCYSTQKEHWLGWLGEYGGPGYYGRKTGKRRSAEYAYNHIVNHEMLLWLSAAAGVKRSLVASARKASLKGLTMQEKSAAIRRHVPWPELVDAMWER